MWKKRTQRKYGVQYTLYITEATVNCYKVMSRIIKKNWGSKAICRCEKIEYEIGSMVLSEVGKR